MPTLRRASRHQRPRHRHTLKLQSTTEAVTKFHGQRVILTRCPASRTATGPQGVVWMHVHHPSAVS